MSIVSCNYVCPEQDFVYVVLILWESVLPLVPTLLLGSHLMLCFQTITVDLNTFYMEFKQIRKDV